MPAGIQFEKVICSRSSWLLAVLLFASGNSASAQDIIASPPQEQAMAPVLRNQQPPLPASQPIPPATPYRIGSIVLHPLLSYSYLNAEGLPSPDGRRVASEIHTVAAGLSIDLGEFWALAYNPSWRNYTARAMTDTFDQSANLSGAIPLGDWRLQFSEGYSQSTPTLIETGRQTKQESWVTSLNTFYDINPVIQFQAGGGVNERYTEIAPDTRTWKSDAGFKFVFSPRSNLSVGPKFSYTEIADAPDIYSESYNASFRWRPTNRLSVEIDSGMQYTHTNASAGSDLSSPVVNFSLNYQPFPTTSLSLTARRSMDPSFFSDQVTKSSGWSVSLNQRLLGRLYLNASYSPSENDYTTIDAAAVTNRQDSVDSYSASLTAQLFGRLTVSATFTLNENTSTLNRFSFSSKQYGVRVAYRY